MSAWLWVVACLIGWAVCEYQGNEVWAAANAICATIWVAIGEIQHLHGRVR